MWLVGKWGQDKPYSREHGFKMTKDENNVWTGKLSLPKGTPFTVMTLKSTVSTTSGGVNTWNAVKYSSVLNNDATHDFGEFTDNLIPNGNFDEGPVKWSPTDAIVESDASKSSPYLLVADTTNKVTSSDVFTIPACQSLRLSGYVRKYEDDPGTITFALKEVAPVQQTLLEFSPEAKDVGQWSVFSRSFNSDDTPTECQIEITATSPHEGWYYRRAFDTLSLIAP